MDWDRDGRLDLWVKNRTGPQLRFLRNEVEAANRFVSLKLQGVRTNRDAVGAVVELTAGGRRRVKQVAAGEGYLAQSSSTLHFGLGGAATVEKLVVRWPGGDEETIEPVAANGRYRILEGSGRAERLDAVPAVLAEVREPDGGPLPPTRLLLKTPLPLPPGLRASLGARPGEVTVVNLWAHWCEPCAGELEAWLRGAALLEARSIRWSPLSLDAPEDREAATAWLRRRHERAESDDPAAPVFVDAETLDTLSVLLEHVTGRAGELPIPANLVLDARGNLQMLVFGSVLPDRFLSTLDSVLDPAVLPARRSLHPGRWYYRSPRNYDELARRLAEKDHADAAAFYRDEARGN